MQKNNLYAINKPKNISSNKLIQHLKKQCNLAKIGHGGTLDPLASGVLIIGINSGTKLLNQSLHDHKQYLATIKFGMATTTYDSEGEITQKKIMNIEKSQIIDICETWKSEPFLQQVPAYSAVKYKGQELYKLSRRGVTVDLPQKLVQLLDYKIVDFIYPILTIELDVSKGFYIRSLAHELGKKLNGCAMLTDLCRTQSGEWLLSDCLTPEEFIHQYNNKQIQTNA